MSGFSKLRGMVAMKLFKNGGQLMSFKAMAEWALSRMYPVEMVHLSEAVPDHLIPACVLIRVVKDEKDFKLVMRSC